MRRIKTTNAFETKKIARSLGRKIIDTASEGAFVVALEGDLGAGKTTFTQGFAEGLGVEGSVLSPTFVLMKTYPFPAGAGRGEKKRKYLVHIDCYRLDSLDDLLGLGFAEMLRDRQAVILIEWADRIKRILPKEAMRIRFGYGEKEEERVIEISNHESGIANRG